MSLQNIIISFCIQLFPSLVILGIINFWLSIGNRAYNWLRIPGTLAYMTVPYFVWMSASTSHWFQDVVKPLIPKLHTQTLANIVAEPFVLGVVVAFGLLIREIKPKSYAPIFIILIASALALVMFFPTMSA